MAFVDEASWAPADWKWDAYSLKAEPADLPISGKSVQGRGAAADAAAAKQGCQVRRRRSGTICWFPATSAPIGFPHVQASR